MFKISAEDKLICLSDSAHAYHALNPPIYQTSIFSFDSIEEFLAYRDKTLVAYNYTRGNNPTNQVLEEKLAQLDGGEKCRVFASGMGASAATLLSLLKSGDHVLILNEVYGPVREYLDYMRAYGIEYSVIAQPQINELAAYTQTNTRLIYCESPGTMTFRVLDLAAVATFARERNILTLIDNTCLTPLLQKPLSLGFDIAIYSLSKYTSGHSDVVAGAVVSSAALIKQIDNFGFKLGGAVLSPHDAFLLLRGLRTLPTRLESLALTTRDVVTWLQQHEQVAEVLHPLSYSPAEQEIHTRQALGYTSLLSLRLKTTDTAAIRQFINQLKTFYITVSWGGFENLIMLQDVNELRQPTSSKVVLRLAIGLLDSETIINDLAQALESINSAP